VSYDRGALDEFRPERGRRDCAASRASARHLAQIAGRQGALARIEVPHAVEFATDRPELAGADDNPTQEHAEYRDGQTGAVARQDGADPALHVRRRQERACSEIEQGELERQAVAAGCLPRQGCFPAGRSGGAAVRGRPARSGPGVEVDRLRRVGLRCSERHDRTPFPADVGVTTVLRRKARANLMRDRRRAAAAVASSRRLPGRSCVRSAPRAPRSTTPCR